MKHPAYDFFVQSGPTIGFWMKGKEIVTGSEVLSEAGVDKFEYRISFKESMMELLIKIYRKQIGYSLL